MIDLPLPDSAVKIDSIANYPTPFLQIDLAVAQANIREMADYVAQHQLGLRPHTKTHKSSYFARLQMLCGAIGLTVATARETEIMSAVADDVLVGYPVVDPPRAARLANLARHHQLRVAVDSAEAAAVLSRAAHDAGSHLGLLVDIDVGHHRTGVQSPDAAVDLARRIGALASVRFDGLMCFPGHVVPTAGDLAEGVRRYGEVLAQAVDALEAEGMPPEIVSGGSTPTARLSHLNDTLTEIRPGTYVFNDMNSILWGCATEATAAARVVATVVSTAAAGKAVVDAGSKTMTSDLCGPDPSRGHGQLDLGDQRRADEPPVLLRRLSEEHGELQLTETTWRPKIGQRVRIIPNHICPCVNLQQRVVLALPDGSYAALPVEAH